MLESDLFGHEKGAFTGAVVTKPGLLEIAHRGTIFMDEIGDMDLAVQPKILKAIEERQYRHMGGTEDRTVDARLIAASHKNLQQLVTEGRFRSDLYYRIGGLPILVPPLRERREDIVPLANYFLSRFASEWRCGSLELSQPTAKTLEKHDWPGNIRELKNALERAIIYRQSHILQPSDFQLGTVGPALTTGVDVSLTLAEVEQQHIQGVLDACGGRVDEAARRLDISRSSLYQRMQRLGSKTKRV
jgi:transcriptional regulator with PAS, ATPase and Fis domain